MKSILLRVWQGLLDFNERMNRPVPVPRRSLPFLIVAYLLGLLLNLSQGGVRYLAMAADATAHWAHDGGTWHRLAACSGLVLLGLGFYWLRSRRKQFYGLLEIAVAISITWSSFDKELTRPVAFATMIGALYVIVRGIDNVMTETFPRAPAGGNQRT